MGSGMFCPGGIQIPFDEGTAAIEWSWVRFAEVDLRFLGRFWTRESLFWLIWVHMRNEAFKCLLFTGAFGLWNLTKLDQWLIWRRISSWGSAQHTASKRRGWRKKRARSRHTQRTANAVHLSRWSKSKTRWRWKTWSLARCAFMGSWATRSNLLFTVKALNLSLSLLLFELFDPIEPQKNMKQSIFFDKFYTTWPLLISILKPLLCFSHWLLKGSLLPGTLPLNYQFSAHKLSFGTFLSFPPFTLTPSQSI